MLILRLYVYNRLFFYLLLRYNVLFSQYPVSYVLTIGRRLLEITLILILYFIKILTQETLLCFHGRNVPLLLNAQWYLQQVQIKSSLCCATLVVKGLMLCNRLSALTIHLLLLKSLIGNYVLLTSQSGSRCKHARVFYADLLWISK